MMINNVTQQKLCLISHLNCDIFHVKYINIVTTPYELTQDECVIFSSEGQDSVYMSCDSCTSTSLVRKPPRVDPNDFTETLGPEQLTALGRVDSARVMVDSLGIANETSKPG